MAKFTAAKVWILVWKSALKSARVSYLAKEDGLTFLTNNPDVTAASTAAAVRVFIALSVNWTEK